MLVKSDANDWSSRMHMGGQVECNYPYADVKDVAPAIVEIVGMPYGTRPFQRHIDPSEDGTDIVYAKADRVRAEVFRRIWLDDLLQVKRPD